MRRPRTLKSKLFLLFVLSILCCSLSAMVSLWILQQQSNHLLYQSTSETLNYSAERFHTTLESIEGLVNLLLSDDSFLYQLRVWQQAPENTAATSFLLGSLSNYSNSSPYISYICLLQEDQMIRYSRYYPIASMISADSRDELASLAHEHAGAICWSVLEEDPDGLFLSRLIRRVDGFDLQELGVLTVRINMPRLLKDLATPSHHLSPKLFLVSSDSSVLFSNVSDTRSILPSLSRFTKPYGILRWNGVPYFIISQDAGFLDLQYYYMISYQSVDTTTHMLYLSSLLIILLSSLLITFVGYRILQGITVHFHTLSQKMNAYSLGHFDPPDVGFDYSQRMDELGTAHIQLDAMAHRIQSLINDNYVKQLLIREAELKELQYQIHPHFLYNTLESINWYARAANEPHIPRIVYALGSILRCSLNSSSLFSFQQEIDLLRNYMTIQEIRYEDRLLFSLEAPPEVMQYELPKMTLLPLVENAIRYAVDENVDPCHIWVDVNLLPAEIRIFVRNTGSHFEEGILEKLDHSKKESHGFGIGLHNIQQRIKLTYGPKYGLTVYNQEEMAVVEIRLPRKPYTGGNENVEMHDRR